MDTDISIITDDIRNRLQDITDIIGGELSFQDWKDSRGNSGVIVRIKTTEPVEF